jgi:hypothetical protein
MNRRIFIERTGRGFLLGGLAVLSGVLIARRQVSQDTNCSANFQCRNCNRLSSCALPEAEIERDHG